MTATATYTKNLTVPKYDLATELISARSPAKGLVNDTYVLSRGGQKILRGSMSALSLTTQRLTREIRISWRDYRSGR